MYAIKISYMKMYMDVTNGMFTETTKSIKKLVGNVWTMNGFNKATKLQMTLNGEY